MMPLPQFPTPEDAERAFYGAIARNDLDALMATWAEGEETVCVHPTGVSLLGLNPIRDSWRSILAAARLRIQADLVAEWHSATLAIHHLLESLFVGDDPAPHGPLHVTHVYARDAQGWRLVSRHASAASDSPAAQDTQPRVLH